MSVCDGVATLFPPPHSAAHYSFFLSYFSTMYINEFIL